MSFNGISEQPRITVWLGNPDCQSAHDAVLDELSQFCSEFLLKAPSDDARLNILKGNLGEFIGFCIGKWGALSSHRAFAANAFTPLGSISKPEIDIVWLYFGEKPSDDIGILQEVKTTASTSLSYADNLIKDYEKLFGTDPALTLQTRLQAIKNRLEYEHKRKDLCARISNLAGQSPQTSLRIQLIPTLVYEREGNNPLTRMVAIRSALCGRGWTPSSVEAWAVGLSDLNARLVRLATGKH